MKQKDPKFQIGDRVSHKPDLYGCTESVVSSFTRIFSNNDGGLAYLERNLKSMRDEIKWEIIEGDEPVLVIHPYPSTEWSISENRMVECMTKESRVVFSGYAYSVKSEKMNTIFSEGSLKKVNN